MTPFLKNIADVAAAPPASYGHRAFILNMHALPTVVDMLEIMLDAGIKRENVLFIAKPYSTIGMARHRLTKADIGFVQTAENFKSGRLIERNEALLDWALPIFAEKIRGCSLTLLDSGGHLTRRMDSCGAPQDMTSIQLTSSGSRITKGRSGGVVDIGSLPLKKEAESAAIAQASLSVMERALGNSGCRKVCVVGKGAMGNALAGELRASYNAEIQHIEGGPRSEPIDADCTLVIGATGYDLSRLVRRSLDPKKNAHLFSCSSWDIEYQTLLAEADDMVAFSPGGHTKVIVKDTNWVVYNAGCPINFDRRQELENPGAMAMTRGLVLAAALQPAAFSQNLPRVKELYKLHY